jgi:hypothetical protein
VGVEDAEKSERRLEVVRGGNRGIEWGTGAQDFFWKPVVETPKLLAILKEFRSWTN